MTDLVRACGEERPRTHTEESVEGGYTREKECRTTAKRMEERVPTIPSTECWRTDVRGGAEEGDVQPYHRP